ncbi:DUF202 domain-containing protein [Leucobacter soli]|uniref:DUF202 domain-containing protein n=1 Tax=Leucobacter soli TaxID=2812850 RepID=UPI00360D99D9
MQAERTALAWRRTALALAIGALLSMRLLPPVLGAWSLLFGAIGIVVGAAVAVLEHRRFVRGAATRGGLPAADGLPVALLTAAVLAAAVLCLILVLAR